MKGIIYYYSTTGNTKLICELIKRKIKSATFEICSILDDTLNNPDDYDIIGFSCFADELQAPELMKLFIKNNPSKTNKYSFILKLFHYNAKVFKGL